MGKEKAPYDKREKRTITKAIENKLNERLKNRGVNDVGLKTCENNQQCNCGLMHRESEEIKTPEVEIVFTDGKELPRLFIDGKEVDGQPGNGGIVSIECFYKTTDGEECSGAYGYKVVYMKEDEDGKLYERTIAVKKLPSNEFEWITK